MTRPQFKAAAGAREKVRQQTSLERYGFALLGVAIALGLRWSLRGVLHNNAPYLMLWPAIAFAAWYCGPAPALVAVLAGAVGVRLFIVPHVPLFVDANTALSNSGIGLAAFLVMSCVIIALGALTRRRMEVEHALALETSAAKSKFEAVFEQTAVFASILDLEGRVQQVNRRCLEPCGYVAADVVGKLFWETPWFGNSTELQEMVKQATLAAAGGASFRKNIPYYWADGTEHFADMSIDPVRDDAGRVLLIHPSGLDVTEFKTVQESYRKLAEALEIQVRERTTQLEVSNMEVLEQATMLRNLSQRLLLAQDDERRRIARELHDSAGQTITALTLGLQTMRRTTIDLPPRVSKQIDESEEQLQQLSREVRTMSYLLHPPLLDELGLSAALNWYVTGLEERGGLAVTVDMPENFGRFARDLDLVLFRLIQECLTNVYRHSSSKTAAIRLAVEGERVTLEVSDQGKGIAPNKLREIRRQGAGVGMQGMRERIRPFQGEMEVGSTPTGTTVRFSFPIPEADDTEPSLESDVV